MDLDPLVNPRGPLPASVYWRRRAVLVVTLVVVVVLLRSCGGDPDQSLRATGNASGTPTASSAVPSGSRTPSARPSPTVTPGGLCRAADLKVSAAADAKSYPPGVRPRLTLSVSNVGPAACRVDLGQPARELRVLSGNDRVWSSDHCSQGGTSNIVLLQQGESRSFAVTWFRRRSVQGCVGGQPEAPSGTYRVFGRIGDIVSGGDVFTLRSA